MNRFPRRRSADSTTRRQRFTEGLVAGALIGAAIAGSTLWTRIRDARSKPASEAQAPATEDGTAAN